MSVTDGVEEASEGGGRSYRSVVVVAYRHPSWTVMTSWLPTA